MFMRKLRKDKRGLTLIELVCAIAILSIITLTIGGAVVFATNSYRQGTIDTALQQEAQFTANSIESLIIDATDTVEYSGGVLTIKNVDYTYVITYNAGEQTLRYSQYVTGDASDIVTENELLAEHVVKFEVDASNFETFRNVAIEIGLANGDSTFLTTYNITSRNDPSAGDPVEVVANILCEDSIVLEPRQEFVLPVSVVGPADTGYSAVFESEVGMSADTQAEVVPGGVKITIGATETGGGDGQLRLLISTDAVRSDGTPFTKWVNVQIRRVNEVSLGTLTLVSGTAAKEGAVYSVSAAVSGSNLEEVPGTSYDMDYIDPNTIKWSFFISNGDSWTEWISVGATGVDEDTLRFTLLKDITTQTVTIRATAQHPEGVLRGEEWTNKASAAATDVRKYGTVFKEVDIAKRRGFGDDILRRGIECYLGASHDYNELIKEEYERRGIEWNDDYGYNGGYKGNTHFRFTSKDSDHEAPWCPNWKLIADQGDDPARIKFNATDFNYMRYLEDYDLELYFSFRYTNMKNEQCIYPFDFDANNPSPNDAYIYHIPVNAMGVCFDKVKDGSGDVIDLAPYSFNDGVGIGSLASPLELTQGYQTQFEYYNIGGAANNRSAIGNVFSLKVYEYTGSGWKYTTSKTFQNQANGDLQSGIATLDTVNQMTKGKIYKLVMGDIDNTPYTGVERYNQDTEEFQSSASGRGLIYIKLK